MKTADEPEVVVVDRLSAQHRREEVQEDSEAVVYVIYGVVLGGRGGRGFGAYEEAWKTALVAAVVDFAGLGVRREGDIGRGGKAGLMDFVGEGEGTGGGAAGFGWCIGRGADALEDLGLDEGVGVIVSGGHGWS